MSKKIQILRAATALFAHKGFQATAMSEVSRLSGVAPATVFYHYRTKEDLFLAVLKNAREKIVDRIREHQAATTDCTGMSRAKKAVTFYLQLAGDMEDAFHLLHRSILYELAENNAVFEQHLENTVSSLVALFHDAIVAGQSDGTVAPLPAYKTALVLYALVDGVVRLNTHKLYSAGSLYGDLLKACERMLQSARK